MSAVLTDASAVFTGMFSGDQEAASESYSPTGTLSVASSSLTTGFGNVATAIEGLPMFALFAIVGLLIVFKIGFEGSVGGGVRTRFGGVGARAGGAVGAS